jgi:hypothetical protein
MLLYEMSKAIMRTLEVQESFFYPLKCLAAFNIIIESQSNNNYLKFNGDF